MEDRKKVTIVTHSSKFHTDDVFAVATLLLVLEKDCDVTVVRSRDKEIIEKADYVVDVGEVYDPEHNRFDHHQEGRAGVRENGIPYASFGLVWKKYGVELCKNNEVASQIDELLVQPVDAHDNGVSLYKEIVFAGIHPYDTQNIRRAFLPSWKEKLIDIDQIFMRVARSAQVLLDREIIRHCDSQEARDIVRKIYEESEDKRLIVFDDYYGAAHHIIEFAEPLFIVFPSNENTWIIETVQDDPESYSDRKSLPQSWAGKSGEELEKVTGVPGSIFCHNNRFLAVAKTKEAILALAEIALNSGN